MKTSLTLYIAIWSFLAVQSCSSDPKTQQPAETAQNKADSVETESWFPETDFDTLRGMYTGNFGDGFINIFLTYVNDKKAVGYNIHKGLQRNISGDVVQHPDYFELTLNEPGDNPYDGVFVLKISKKDFSADATWTAKDPKISTKKFKLTRKVIPKRSDEKAYYDGGPITENNFLEVFSRSQLNDDDLSFDENGLVTLTYYPVEQKTRQLETVTGSWKFNSDKSLLIEWEKNTYLKERSMTFKLVQKKDDEPFFKGPGGIEITLNYF